MNNLLILPCQIVKKIIKILNTPINFQSKKVEDFNSLEEVSFFGKGDVYPIKQKYIHNSWYITSDEYQELINQIKELSIKIKENRIQINRLYKFTSILLVKNLFFWIIILTCAPYVWGKFFEIYEITWLPDG